MVNYRRRSITLHPMPHFACVLLMLLLAACAGQPGGSSAGLEAPADTAATASRQVDPALWERLTVELARAIAGRATPRSASGVPTAAASQVPDLSLIIDAANDNLEWTYRQQGDYDLNGAVNISDLVQVGINFGKTTLDADWQTAQLADGNGDGSIGVSDVTAIGQNWEGRIDGYELQWRKDDTQPWAVLYAPNLAPGTPATGLYPYYGCSNPSPATAREYRVLPFAQDGLTREYGMPSRTVGSLQLYGSTWSTKRADKARDGFVLAQGPSAPDNIWTYDLGAAMYLSIFNEPVSDATGTIYIGITLDNTLAVTAPGWLYAINPDGKLRWKFQTIGGICGAPSCRRDGRLVVADTSGMVYCLAPDGKQIWRRQLLGASVMTAPLLEDNGTAYISIQTVTLNSITSTTLYKLDPDGGLVWSRDLGAVSLSSPVFNPDMYPTLLSDDGWLTTYTPDGAVYYYFQFDSLPRNNSFARGMMLAGDNFLYSTEDYGVRAVAHDNTSSTLVTFGTDPMATMPVMNLYNQGIAGTIESGTIPKLLCYEGINQQWEVTLAGNLLTNIAMDIFSQMYVGTCFLNAKSKAGENCVYCIQADSTRKWFYETGAACPVAIAITSNGQLACLALGGSGMQLIGISSN